MSGIQPRTLSNRELIEHCALYLELADDNIPMPKGLPIAWQTELLRRFNVLSPLDEYPPADPAQLDLFPETK